MYLSARWNSIFKFQIHSGNFTFIILSLIFYFFNLRPIHGFNVEIEKPLIFYAKSTPGPDYYGYSVGLMKTKDSQGFRLLVAAPKHGSFGMFPGMLYKCQYSYKELTNKDIKCDTQVELPDVASPDVAADTQKQWLGVAMDVNENAGKFIVCAHRWCEVVSNQYRMAGACYIFSTSNPKQDEVFVPLLKIQKKNGVFYHGMAQFGASAQFSKNHKDILFGAPGIYQGRGGFVIKDIMSDNFTTIDYSNSANHFVFSEEEYEDSMIGYAITSGRFFSNEVQIAVGGPGPSTNGLGKVLVYAGGNLIGRYYGSQYGGGFGSSLASGNFYGNSHDDLVVGAPMEYDVVNEGRVYILKSTGKVSFLDEKIVLVGDNVPGAYFGTTVANIGDLNKDGLDDIAVGAPFQDESGVVYIYYGNPVTIDETKMQKIVGKNLSPELKGFGISFSKPRDIDDNGYLDFAVGAFLSDKVVLLRTRPVIKINTTIKSSPPDLNPQNKDCFGEVFKAGCVNLSVSINLIGKAFKNVDLDISISVDIEKSENQKRAALNKVEDADIQMELGLDNHFNKIYELKTRKTKDLFKAIVINLRVIVKSNLTENNISPVQDLLQPTTIRYEIPFLNDCGADKLCAVDLQTHLKWLGKEKNNVLLIGGEHQFKIGVSVANGADPAYQTIGTLRYPEYIDYVSFTPSGNRKPISCQSLVSGNSSQSQNENKVVCNFNNPFRKGLLYYELTFDIHPKSLRISQFEMEFSLTSEGFEMYPDSNKALLSIKMRKKADLSVTKESDPQYILVSQKKNEKSNSSIRPITHHYSFYNNGPSYLEKGNFTIKVYKLQSLSRELHIEANSTDTYPVIHCGQITEMSEFYEMKCRLREWLKESLLSIKIYMTMDIAKLENNLPSVKSELIMESVKDTDYVNGFAIEEKIYSVITNSRSPGKPKPVETWIIVVCVIFGILLLSGFVAGLWKCGFFKRQKVHHIRAHEGSMKCEVQPDPDSQPLSENEHT